MGPSHRQTALLSDPLLEHRLAPAAPQKVMPNHGIESEPEPRSDSDSDAGLFKFASRRTTPGAAGPVTVRPPAAHLGPAATPGCPGHSDCDRRLGTTELYELSRASRRGTQSELESDGEASSANWCCEIKCIML